MTAVLLATAVGAAAQHDASQMRLQLLNGKTGKPIAHEHVSLFAEDGVRDHKPKPILHATTDGEGFVTLPEVTPVPLRLMVLTEKFYACSKTNVRSFNYTSIASRGVVSENSCKPRISLFPQAGTLVFFVRPETWLDRMRQ